MSFDPPAANKRFQTEESFPYPLLSDETRLVADAYGTRRDGEPDLPKRISYIIDPTGVIARSYEVRDLADHAEEVLRDLRALV